jgi:hypothetical protein
MRVSFSTYYGQPQSEILKCFGLATDCELVQIERQAAIDVLTYWLHRHLDSGELMPSAETQGFAFWLLEQFQTEDSAFYTNGDWGKSLVSRGWMPCTTSGCDGGVIATSGPDAQTRKKLSHYGGAVHWISPGLAACIWFEEDD